MPITSNLDKRKFQRVPVKVNFHVDDAETNETGQLFFASKNVSLGGAFLTSDLLLEKGTLIRVRFQLPGEELIEASAEVVWVGDDEDADSGMGISFVNISQADSLTIDRYTQNNG